MTDFTVDVKREDPNSNISINDLKMWHRECGEGQISVSFQGYDNSLDLHCYKCGSRVSASPSYDDRLTLLGVAKYGWKLKINAEIIVSEDKYKPITVRFIPWNG